MIPLRAEQDEALAALIRRILKGHGLDIPGTAYYDPGLDHLSGSYDGTDGEYYALTAEGRLIGGVGFSAFGGFERCCELQKLYLDESFRGRGLGGRMLAFIEQRAAELGFQRIYLETHTSLQEAIRLYERTGYRRIGRPACVVHGTMDRFYLKELCPG